MLLRERFQITRPLEELELALLRAALANPALVNAHEEAVLRTALSLAKLYKVHHDGRDVARWFRSHRRRADQGEQRQGEQPAHSLQSTSTGEVRYNA